MTPYPLHRSERSSKVLITLFLATMAVSILVAELNVKDKVGWTLDGVVARYGPDESPGIGGSAKPDTAPAGMAPSVSPEFEEFPLESGSNAAGVAEPAVPADSMLVARMNTFTLLLDVTHPHVFELPLVLFVLAHFLMRTRVPDWLKLSAYFASFAGIAAFLGTPWLVRYVSLAMAPLMLVGAALIGLTALVMITVPLVDMWLPAPTSKGRRATDEQI